MPTHFDYPFEGIAQHTVIRDTPSAAAISLKHGNARSPYSLRHYAQQTRLRKSEGKVNIYWLAENAGTSVEQLERFYLKRMEPTGERVRNIQSFGDG